MKNNIESFRQERGQETARALGSILDKYKDKRVVVVGIPGSGKSTLLKHLPEARDMDTVIPKLSRGEREFVFQNRRDPETGKVEKLPYDAADPKDQEALVLSAEVLQTLVEMHLKVEPGHPQFSTLVLPSDVVIYLKIDDELLRERLQQRETDGDRPQQYDYVKEIERLTEQKINEAKAKGIQVEEFEMKKGLHDK